MKKTLLFILLFELFFFNFSFSNTHYVSKTGTSTSPYISWETAADSIWKGIDAASYGDTVRVGPGTYYETVVMIPGIALIGAGMDSTIVEVIMQPPGDYIDIVTGADSSSIEGFTIRGKGSLWWMLEGIVSNTGTALKSIKNNKIIKCWTGIFTGGNPDVANNIIDSCDNGICTGGFNIPLIRNNLIKNCGEGMGYGMHPQHPRLIKNIIFNCGRGILELDPDTLEMYGNLIYDIGDLGAMGIGHPLYTDWVVIENNLASCGYHEGLSIAAPGEVRNSIFEDGYYAIHAGGGVTVSVSYSDLWNNLKNYEAVNGAIIDTSKGGNIYKDPMFVNPDRDFHLQKYSPCIDAGDPVIKDPDSSRSDIGCYGGLYGETYTYLDLPPKAPDSLNASFDSIAITLTWKPNTEADLSHYLIYKDTIFNFIPDTFKIVGIISKDSSLFKDYNWEYGKTYYYKLSAYDLTDHQSPYSDELMIKATDVPWTDEIKVEIEKYSLSQNYPNPFNPITVIVYYLPDLGYQPAEVELTIYNVLGKQVRTLVKERQRPGEHRAIWDGKDDEGKDVASGIYFYRLKVSGVDFVKAKKMVLIR